MGEQHRAVKIGRRRREAKQTSRGSVSRAFLLVLSLSLVSSRGQSRNRTIELGLYFRFSEWKELGNGTEVRVGLNAIHDRAGIAASAMMAVKHGNERDGRIVPLLQGEELMKCPLNFSFHVVDTHSRPQEALGFFLKHSPKPRYIIGASRSTVSASLALVAGIEGIPMTSYWSTSTALDDAANYPLFTRTIPADDAVAFAMGSYFQELGYERVAMIFAEDTYGTAFKNAMFERCQALGIELRSIGYTVGNRKSIEFAVQNVVDLKLNVIVGVILGEDLEAAMHKAVELQWTGRGKLWMFSDSVSPGTISELVQSNRTIAEALNGTMKMLAVGGVMENSLFKDFRAEWGNFAEHLEYMNSYLPGGSRSDDRTFSVKLEISSFSSISALVEDIGSYSYDAAVTAMYSMCLLENRGEEWTGFDVGELLHNGNFSFQGVTGNVDFATTGSRNPASANIRLLNTFVYPDTNRSLAKAMEYEIVTKTVGSWSETSSWSFDLSQLRYSPGDETAPPDDVTVVPPKLNYITPGVKAVSFFFCALVYVECLAFTIWTLANYKSPIVRAAQPEFLLVILLGAAISVSAVIPLSFDENAGVDVETLNRMCMASWWLWTLGTSLLVSAIIVKLYRILRIFNNSRLRTVIIKSREMFLVIASVFLLHVLVMLIWQLVSPMVWDREVIDYDLYMNVLESYGHCRGESESAIAFVIVLGIIHLTEYIGGAVFAYKCRDLPSDFHEAKHLSFSLYSGCQLFVIGVPTVVAVDSRDTSTLFLVVSMIICVINLVLISGIFVPKIRRVAIGVKYVSLDPPKNVQVNGGGPSTVLDGSISVLHNSQLSSRSLTGLDNGDQTPQNPSFEGPNSRTISASLPPMNASVKTVDDHDRGMLQVRERDDSTIHSDDEDSSPSTVDSDSGEDKGMDEHGKNVIQANPIETRSDSTANLDRPSSKSDENMVDVSIV